MGSPGHPAPDRAGKPDDRNALLGTGAYQKGCLCAYSRWDTHDEAVIHDPYCSAIEYNTTAWSSADLPQGSGSA